MAIIKCKMCGGNLEITEGVTVAECEYCGTRQTVPSADSEKKLTLFSRANRLRLACEFDKAAGVYESIVADFPEEAEAYWGLVLCRYGIEYVDDPATGKKIPTCHRSSFDSVLEDGDFEQACENADAIARRVYREEAKAIEDIRRGILEVSGKEQPYDIFICYKETDESGERTIDSVLAQDVYDALTEKGYRVFFSRITLEDKLGTEYEPYIFAALNSAKIMLVFGTDYEYFNAVWVKNEWSRYLKLMAQDKGKYLIPCYKNVDAYDMPKEFAKLQAQDMGKVGATQDLLRGIDKLLGRGAAAQSAPVTVQAAGGPTVESLLKRGQMLLEDKDWNGANKYFDKVLDIDPECAEAYVGKFLSFYGLASLSNLEDKVYPLDSSREFLRAEQFADTELTKELKKVRASNELRFQRFRLWDVLKKHHRNLENQKIALEEEARRREEEARRQEESDRTRRRLKLVREKLSKAVGCIAAGEEHTVGLRSDGTVVAVGRNVYKQCNVSKWTDIVAVAAWKNLTVGLRSDGTVVAVGDTGHGRYRVSNWTDIVAVAVGEKHIAGLKSDGTVVVTDENLPDHWKVSGWTDIVAIAAGEDLTVGLRSDGTVVSTKYGTSGWQDIVAVTVWRSSPRGLKSDGTVVGGYKLDKQTDIVAVAEWYHSVGLKSDGTVVAVGEYNEYGERNVSDWKDIVAVAAGREYTVGLKSDGTVVAVGNNKYGQCNVSEWKLFNSLDTLEEERAEVRRKKEEEARRQEEARRKEEEARQKRKAELEAEKAALQTELAGLKGFFTGKRRKEIEARLAAIDAELKKL